MSTQNAFGLTYEDVIGLSWLAYEGTVGRWRFGNGKFWEITTVNETFNFRAVVVTSSEGKKILSFSGTDSGLTPDWIDNLMQGTTGMSWQYSYAAGVALYHRPDMLVGHSLGGGLASYVAIHQGRNAATINPAPLHLVGAGNGPLMVIFKNKVINYVAKGEALDLLDILPSMARVGTINYVPSIGKDPIQKHLLRYLAAYVAPMPA